MKARRWTKRRSKAKTFERPCGRRLYVFFAAIVFLCFNSCQSLKRAAAPVAVFDARVRECPAESGGQGLGVEFTAVNLSGRPVQSVQFYASVEAKEDGGDGIDVGGAFSEASWTLDGGLGAGEKRTLFVPLEGLDDSVDADDLEVECVRVESAVYEGGEKWGTRL